MRADADQTDAQAVFKLMDGIRRDGEKPFLVADVGAQADGVKVVQVIEQGGNAVVEIVIAQRHELIARQIHHGGDGMRAVGVAGQAGRFFLGRKASIEIGQRRALNGVTAVDDERIAVVGIFRRELHQPHRAILHVSVVGGVEVAMGIRGIANSKRFIHIHSCYKGAVKLKPNIQRSNPSKHSIG